MKPKSIIFFSSKRSGYAFTEFSRANLQKDRWPLQEGNSALHNRIRHIMRPTSDRTADAPTGFESKAPAPSLASGQRRAVHERYLIECFGSHVLCPFCEPQMGRGLHLYLDRRRLALCGSGRRSLLPACGRLVDERDDDGAARHRCSHHDDLAPGQTRRAVASLRPRQPSTPASRSSG